MGYKITLDIYNGPLDLLLHLIRREEVDIYDIPIAKITEQYLAYLDVLKVLDINLAGDFIVMAATLMEIKARMLLPRPEVEGEEEEDPRLELVRQLIEYRKFKDAGRTLGEYAQERAMRFARVGEHWPEDKEEDEPLKEVALWDLVDAFSSILKQTTLVVGEIIYDDTPIEVYRAEILDCLKETPVMSFSRLFEGKSDRLRIIGIFLALLELIRLRKVKAEQTRPFGEIQIVLREEDASKSEVEVSADETNENDFGDIHSSDDQEGEMEAADEVIIPDGEDDALVSTDATAIADVKTEVELEFSEFIGDDEPREEPTEESQKYIEQSLPLEDGVGEHVEEKEVTKLDRKCEDKLTSNKKEMPEGLLHVLWQRGKTLVADFINCVKDP